MLLWLGLVAGFGVLFLGYDLGLGSQSPFIFDWASVMINMGWPACFLGLSNGLRESWPKVIRKMAQWPDLSRN